MPTVIAYHVIFSAYGFWLANDERGSYSDFVRRWELVRHGRATPVDTHRSVARRPFSRMRRDAARADLRYPPVVFTGLQAVSIARGFADGVRRSEFVILACAILPDHVHLVIGRHVYAIEHVVNRLKGAATRELTAAAQHPLATCRTPAGGVPSPWAEGLWKVYLNNADDVRRAVAYAEENPEKAGLRRHQRPFVTPWQPWLGS